MMTRNSNQNNQRDSMDEAQLLDASMDNVDFDGEPLNVKGFGIATLTSSDLDLQAAEEDEENNEP